MYGPDILSKICDTNDINAIKRHKLDADLFPTEAERQALRFIEDYAEQNGGKAPSGVVVAGEVPGFTYLPGVEDSLDWMVGKLKDAAGKRKIVELFQSGEPEKWLNEEPAEKVAKLLTEALESITIQTSVRTKTGTNVKTDIEKFREEYYKRKAGESFRIWKSKFPSINEEVGGYYSSNVYTVYGKSGRGKSVITVEEAIECAMQGANVLVWSMEMGWYEVMVRIYVSVSARLGVTTANIGDSDILAGFESGAVRKGDLSDEFEAGFMRFLEELPDIMPGNIIVRSVDDDDFNRRDLKTLESEIIKTDADVVVIDPFYYLDYERNTSKTAGGDAANTSKKLRRLAGRTKTVVFAITQAEETQEEKNEDGSREIKLPERAGVKKTKQLMEDAYLLIAVDTDYRQKRGLIGLNKGRDGGEGVEVEITYIPEIGVVRELPNTNEIAKHFDF